MSFPNEERVISEFVKSIGPWRKHVVIGGGYALFIYRLFLANQPIGNPPVGTRDLDSLIPRKIPEASTKNISKYLKHAGFKVVFKNYENPPIEAYVKEIDGFDVEVEFLTDSNTRQDPHKNVLIAGVVAQPLSYLRLSLQNTIGFTTSAQEMGLVVSPGAWIFHKGLTFPKRIHQSKIYKDLYGIWYTATQLGGFSDLAITEFFQLTQQHQKWFETFKRNLQEWINNASPIDWVKLETQDPFGTLKKAAFEQLAIRMTNFTCV